MPIANICCTVGRLVKMCPHEIFERSCASVGTATGVATVEGGAVASFGFGYDTITLAYWAPGWLLHFLFWCWRAGSDEAEQATY